MNGTLQAHTKTYVVRQVHLDPVAMAVIEDMKKYRLMHSDEVFYNPDTGQPFETGKALRKVWNTSLAVLGLKHRKMYNTRHSYATWGISDGINPAYLATQLGHSLQVFFKVYAKWLEAGTAQTERAKRDAVMARGVQKCGKSVATKSKRRLTC